MKSIRYVAKGYIYNFKMAPWSVAAILTSRILMGISPFLNAVLIQGFMDSVTKDTAGKGAGDFRSAAFYLAAIFLLEMLLILVSVGTSYVNSRFYSKMLMKSYMNIYEHISGISSEFLEVEENQRKIDYIMENSIWAPFRISNILMNVVQAVLCLGSFLIFIFMNNKLITIVYGAALLFYIAAMSRSGEKKYRLSEELFDESRKQKNYSNILYGSEYAKELRVYRYGEYMASEWRKLSYGLLKPRLDLEKKNLLRQNLYCIFVNLFLILFFVSAGFGIKAGILGIGVISAIVSYLPDLNYAVSALGGLSANFRETYLLLVNLFDYLEGDCPHYDGTEKYSQPFEGEIRVRNLSFSYPGSDREVLKDVSLTIKKGEQVAFVGENGAGKTTLAYLLAGVYMPTEGTIEMDGHDYKKTRLSDILGKFMIVSQKIHKFHIPFRDNILLGREKKEDYDTLIREIGLDSLVGKLEGGEDEILGRKFGKVDVSGGEWQKLSILRGYAGKGEICILDEPTSALDPKMEYQMFRMFGKMNRGKTMILVSHRLGALKDVDRIYFLQDGVIAEQGTHEELIRQGGKYAAMYDTQKRWYE